MGVRRFLSYFLRRVEEGAGAEVVEEALGTLGFSGGAEASAVFDELEGEANPVVAWDFGFEFLGDAEGVGVFCPSESLGEACDVGIHDDS